jgi:TolB-like protein
MAKPSLFAKNDGMVEEIITALSRIRTPALVGHTRASAK